MGNPRERPRGVRAAPRGRTGRGVPGADGRDASVAGLAVGPVAPHVPLRDLADDRPSVADLPLAVLRLALRASLVEVLELRLQVVPVRVDLRGEGPRGQELAEQAEAARPPLPPTTRKVFRAATSEVTRSRSSRYDGRSRGLSLGGGSSLPFRFSTARSRSVQSFFVRSSRCQGEPKSASAVAPPEPGACCASDWMRSYVDASSEVLGGTTRIASARIPGWNRESKTVRELTPSCRNSSARVMFTSADPFRRARSLSRSRGRG